VLATVTVAQAADPISPAEVITQAETIFTSVSLVAVVILLFGISVRLVRRYLK